MLPWLGLCDAGVLCWCLALLCCWLAPEALEGVGAAPPGFPCWLYPLLVVVNVAAGGVLPGAGGLVFWAFIESFLPMPDTPDSRPEKLSSRPAMVATSMYEASGRKLRTTKRLKIYALLLGNFGWKGGVAAATPE